MAGGGGDSRYSGLTTLSIETRIQAAREQEQQRLDGDVNALLQRALARFNQRDAELTGSRLDELAQCIDLEFDKILLAGSVAKRTAVDGISDVDALVLFDKASIRGKNADAVKEQLRLSIESSLSRKDVTEVKSGDLAVTVKYEDGMEIQLLPAVRQGKFVDVPRGHGGKWIETDPKAFRTALTNANSRLGGGLVPAIKLMKAVMSKFPEQKRLSGYHIEALAVDAAKSYDGANTPKALVIGLFKHATSRVLKPISDKTGQSKTIDGYLGAAGSAERKNISLTLDGMRRRLETATSVSEWKAVLGES